MTTKQIDYCIELAHTLNFSRAAENAFVSQPTFSYQLRLLEEEIGFRIFERSGKGAALTPAGEQFVAYLTGMREELKRAVEQGQNFSARYRENITVSMMVRQAIYFLPEAIRTLERERPGVLITPLFQYEGGVEAFLSGGADVLFALSEQTRHIPGINVHKLSYLRQVRPACGEGRYHRRGHLRAHAYGWRRVASGAEKCAAEAYFVGQNRVFQQPRPRYDARQYRFGQGRLPRTGVSQ